MQQPAHPFGAQQGRIAFDVGVQALLFHQVSADSLNLIRWAAMHRGQGHIVGYTIGYLQLPDFGIKAGYLVNQGLLVSGAIAHLLQEPLHIRFVDSREVVTNTEIENNAGYFTGKTQLVVQGMDQYPGTQVLIK